MRPLPVSSTCDHNVAGKKTLSGGWKLHGYADTLRRGDTSSFCRRHSFSISSFTPEACQRGNKGFWEKRKKYMGSYFYSRLVNV